MPASSGTCFELAVMTRAVPYGGAREDRHRGPKDASPNRRQVGSIGLHRPPIAVLIGGISASGAVLHAHRARIQAPSSMESPPQAPDPPPLSAWPRGITPRISYRRVEAPGHVSRSVDPTTRLTASLRPRCRRRSAAAPATGAEPCPRSLAVARAAMVATPGAGNAGAATSRPGARKTGPPTTLRYATTTPSTPTRFEVESDGRGHGVHCHCGTGRLTDGR